MSLRSQRGDEGTFTQKTDYPSLLVGAVGAFMAAAIWCHSNTKTKGLAPVKLESACEHGLLTVDFSKLCDADRKICPSVSVYTLRSKLLAY